MAAVTKFGGKNLQQLIASWNALDMRKRIIVAVSSLVMFLLVLMVARIANTPSMALLYSGLEPSVSGEIVSALEQRGVAFSISGDAIYVDSSKRDLMRVSLAEEGLPAAGNAGYELLEGLTGFGTTAQMFDAAYWRAKEGELARTILAWPQIKYARVHIANTVAQPLRKSAAPVASVTLKLSTGTLSSDRARAMQYLVASAVSGLSPQDVSVIDSDSGIVASDTQNNGYGTFQNTKAEQIRQNVERIIAARVGAENVIVEVTVDTTMEQETIVEHRFDPDSRVAISTDTEEVSGSSSDQGGAAVTVASNLPEGDASKGGSNAKSSSTETRERVNYEVSETTRELIKQPGKINRISVAVMVDGQKLDQPDGTLSWVPRPEEELVSLRELVQSAIGFDEARGDTVTIKSMELFPAVESGSSASASPFAFFALNAMTLIQLGILSFVTLGLGMFVLKPILTTQLPLALPRTEFTQLPGMDGGGFPAIGSQFIGQDPANLDPVAQLRQLIAERQEETVEVLRNWIESSEELA